MNGEPQILTAKDRFSKWPTSKICKTSDTKEVIGFLSNQFNLYDVPEKIRSDKGGASISTEYKEICKSRIIEIQYCPLQMHTGNGTVERAIQTMKNLILANMEDGKKLTESVNRALRVMRFTLHTGLKKTPFELHHGQKPKTELSNIIKDGKSFLSNWSDISISAPNRPKIPIYVGRDADGEITNHIALARTKTEERQLAAETKSPKKRNSVRYPFKFLEKRHNRKSLEGIFQSKTQTAISGTENTVKTDTGRIIHQKFISGPLFQSEKRHPRESAPTVSAEITPKNRHCLRGLDGKYGKWDENLRDILNGKLRIVQNKKQTETETEDEDDDDDDEEVIPEEAGKTYDTSEREGRYAPIRTDPENDAIQIHTDGKMPQGENTENNHRRSNRNKNRPNRYGIIYYKGNFWV